MYIKWEKRAENACTYSTSSFKFSLHKYVFLLSLQALWHNVLPCGSQTQNTKVLWLTGRYGRGSPPRLPGGGQGKEKVFSLIHTKVWDKLFSQSFPSLALFFAWLPSAGHTWAMGGLLLNNVPYVWSKHVVNFLIKIDSTVKKCAHPESKRSCMSKQIKNRGGREERNRKKKETHLRYFFCMPPDHVFPLPWFPPSLFLLRNTSSFSGFG